MPAMRGHSETAAVDQPERGLRRIRHAGTVILDPGLLRAAAHACCLSPQHGVRGRSRRLSRRELCSGLEEYTGPAASSREEQAAGPSLLCKPPPHCSSGAPPAFPGAAETPPLLG